MTLEDAWTGFGTRFHPDERDCSVSTATSSGQKAKIQPVMPKICPFKPKMTLFAPILPRFLHRDKLNSPSKRHPCRVLTGLEAVWVSVLDPQPLDVGEWAQITATRSKRAPTPQPRRVYAC
jgi:hypothetical protein